jgi:glycerate-2-kinase
MIIKNVLQLSTTPTRKQVLRILDAGLQAINTEQLMHEQFAYDKNADILYINQQAFSLKDYDKVVIVGAGKVAAKVAEVIETKMIDRIAGGLIIDIVPATTHKIVSRVGTHPLPSSANVSATNEIIAMLEHLTERDLVIAIIGGGGSSLLTSPQIVSLEEERKITQALMNAGASIFEMNTVRKHLSSVKGGGLAKYAYPATVISLIFSDIPGDDISMVASGPTVYDRTTTQDAMAIMEKYQVLDRCNMDNCGLKETPKETKYFEKVHNILFCSGQTALQAMERAAHDLGLRVRVWSRAFLGEAKEVAAQILADIQPGECLVAVGESVVTIKSHESKTGSGGRNQEMTLAALLLLPPNTTFAALNSDGRDNSDVAGGIVDNETLKQAQSKGIDLKFYLDRHDEYSILSDLNASIMTGNTGSNVSDFIVVIRE